MLFLKKISLVQFKNYQLHTFNFNEKIIGICGNNGMGKTNLLDAIYYLCFGKSYFSRSDAVSVMMNYNGFRIEGDFLNNELEEKMTCVLRETGQKELALNQQLYPRFSKHIGHYPCVIIAPDDIQIINGSGEHRRKLMNALLCQEDEEYMTQLINYGKIILQRNSLLKKIAEHKSRDFSLLDVLDEQLAQAGNFIFEKRKQFINLFIPMVNKHYEKIAGVKEQVELAYNSALHEKTLIEILKQNRQLDLQTQRTNSGIHKDDIEFRLNQNTFKQIASQGQKKSLLFALKIAELESLYAQKNIPPFLLLDDVFEKLDESRIANLLNQILENKTSQIFITDTNAERLQQHVENLKIEMQVIEIGNSNTV